LVDLLFTVLHSTTNNVLYISLFSSPNDIGTEKR